MSFDLAVWKSARPLTPDEAQEIYEKLCEDEPPDSVPDCAEMKAFSAELMKRWPEDPSNPEACPFEDVGPASRFLILNLAGSRAPEVAPQVIALARRHGLLCYDPQEGKVHSGASRPWWRFWS